MGDINISPLFIFTGDYMKYDISKNNRGQISTSSVIILLVVVLIIWQLVFPYFNIPSLTETFGLEEEDPIELTFSAGLFNTDTGTYRTTTDLLIDVDPNPRNEDENLLAYDLTLSGVNTVENHQVIIITNAPKRLYNAYTVIIVIKKVTWTHETFQTTIYSQAITSGASGDKTFKRTLMASEVLLAGALYEYSTITCRLLDYNGDILFTEKWSVY